MRGKTVELQGAWQGRYTGGCIKNPLWYDNPQFLLRPSCEAKFKIELRPLDDQLCIGLVLLYGSVAEVARGPLSTIIIQSQYRVSKTQSLEVQLGPMAQGHCYVILPTTREAGISCPFHIKVSSADDDLFRFEARASTLVKKKPRADAEAVAKSVAPRTASELLLQSRAYLSGHAYEGEWEGEKFHGIGCFYFSDGQLYVGEWRNGVKHGHGTLRTREGVLLRGEWVNGEASMLVPVRGPHFPSYVQSTFEMFDRDGNGQLSMVELHAALAELGLQQSINAAQHIMEAFDTDNNKSLSCVEFASLVRELCEHQVRQREAQQAAAGFVPRAELRETKADNKMDSKADANKSP